MAYTNNLDETVPAQTEKFKLGAQRIRELTRALRERLASLFVNPDADPLVLKANTVGTTQLIDDSVTGAKISDAAIELAHLSATAKTNLYKVIQVEDHPGVPSIFAPAMDAFYSKTIEQTFSVDGLSMFVSVKSTNLVYSDIAKLDMVAFGVGSFITIVVNNHGPAGAVDLSGTIFLINILVPL